MKKSGAEICRQAAVEVENAPKAASKANSRAQYMRPLRSRQYDKAGGRPKKKIQGCATMEQVPPELRLNVEEGPSKWSKIFCKHGGGTGGTWARVRAEESYREGDSKTEDTNFEMLVALEIKGRYQKGPKMGGELLQSLRGSSFELPHPQIQGAKLYKVMSTWKASHAQRQHSTRQRTATANVDAAALGKGGNKTLVDAIDGGFGQSQQGEQAAGAAGEVPKEEAPKSAQELAGEHEAKTKKKEEARLAALRPENVVKTWLNSLPKGIANARKKVHDISGATVPEDTKQKYTSTFQQAIGDMTVCRSKFEEYSVTKQFGEVQLRNARACVIALDSDIVEREKVLALFGPEHESLKEPEPRKRSNKSATGPANA